MIQVEYLTEQLKESIQIAQLTTITEIEVNKYLEEITKLPNRSDDDNKDNLFFKTGIYVTSTN